MRVIRQEMKPSNETWDWDGLTSGLCLTQINMAEICHPYGNTGSLWRTSAPDASKDFCDCIAFLTELFPGPSGQNRGQV